MTTTSSSSLLLDPRLESMRDSHERSTGIIVSSASSQDIPATDQTKQPGQPNNQQPSSSALQDLASISRAHIDPNNPNQDPQATIRQFQAADPERFNQLLKSIPGALQQMQSQSQQDVPMPPPGMHNGTGPQPGQPSGPPPSMYAPHPDDPQHPQHPHHHHYTQHAAAVAAHAHAQQQMASGSGARHSADLSPPSRSGSPDERGGGSGGVGPSVKPSGPPKGRKRREGINSEDWARVRKDNHKEVERRRRGTINQGINELGMIIPNSGGGERAKGAVLNRAVIYIRQLKENEARNIEKWTLEKLLMDQAMGDLQAQMEDMRRRWDDDRSRLGMLERELTDVRAQLAAAKAAATSESTAGATTSESAGNKRQRVD